MLYNKSQISSFQHASSGPCIDRLYGARKSLSELRRMRDSSCQDEEVYCVMMLKQYFWALVAWKDGDEAAYVSKLYQNNNRPQEIYKHTHITHTHT